MQRKDLALRVLSTAAIMSIVTSIAAPAFAGTYYMANGNLSIRQDENGKVYVKSGDSDELEDKDKEVIICGGAGDNKWSNAPSGGAADEQQPHPNAGSTLNETQEGSAQTEEGSAQTKEGSAQTEGGSAQTKEGSAQTKEGSAQTKEDSAQTKEGSAQTQEGSAQTEEDSAQTQEGSAQTQEGSAQTQEGSAQTEEDSAQTRKAALAPAPAADPALTTPAAGSATTSTTNVIKVVNNWVGAAAKELKIRLSNVNIKSSTDAAMTVSGDGNTKIELDGKNTLDSSNVSGKAGLNKQGNGTMTITDEKTDGGETRTSKAANDETGSLTVVGGVGAAGIGGNHAGSLNGSGDTKNITIEGYATVDATSGKNSGTESYGGAGIGGGNFGSADNIIIQGNANVTAKAGYHSDGAAIGGGTAGSGTNIGIYDHATVKASGGWMSAAIGRGSYGQKASVTIGREGKTQENENVHVTASAYISAIGGMAGVTGTAADQTTDIVIQGGATIEKASSAYGGAIGSDSGVCNIIIRGHAVIKKAVLIGERGFYHTNRAGDKVTVSIEDHARLENVKAIGGKGVEEANVTVKDNAYVGTVQAIGEYNDDFCNKIGKLTAKILDNATIEKLSGWIGKRPNSTVDESEVIVDGGETGKVTVTASALSDKAYINAQKVEIKNNVLLKLKQSSDTDEPNYIAANGVEMTRDDLMRTIGDDAEIWYTDKDNHLQKIVHGKNRCTKHETGHQDATCTEKGWKEYGCTLESNNHAAAPTHTDKWKEYTPALGHHWVDNGEANHICDRDHVTTEAHSYGEWTIVTPATCTTAGEEKHTCSVCGHVETQEIPATGHHWVDRGDGTHTCPDCGATEGQPSNTNSALELRVVDAEGMDQPFTVSQNGTLRTYTGAYNMATLTGDLDTLRYLQDHGAQTIQFVTNGQTSSFAINDLLAQGSGSEVFYLTHRGAEEPTLLLVEADHSDLVKD
jgi:hypothetical protein